MGVQALGSNVGIPAGLGNESQTVVDGVGASD